MSSSSIDKQLNRLGSLPLPLHPPSAHLASGPLALALPFAHHRTPRSHAFQSPVSLRWSCGSTLSGLEGGGTTGRANCMLRNAYLVGTGLVMMTGRTLGGWAFWMAIVSWAVGFAGNGEFGSLA
jgi:hypothetical protein